MGDQIGAVKTLFSDTFSGPLSTANWDYNHWQQNNNPSFYGRTQIRQSLPDAGNGVVRLKLDTYNPGDKDHKTFIGAQMITRKAFGPAKQGAVVAFEVKAKFENVPKGLVGGIFTFSGNAKSHNAIDWEALSNDLAAGKSQIQTNVYANAPLGAGHVKFVPIALPLTDYHVYGVEWLPNQVRWLVDGKVVRVETEHVPDKAMNLHINLWAPSSGWKNAYSDTLKPAASEGAKKSYYFDATYAKVFELSTACGNAKMPRPATSPMTKTAPARSHRWFSRSCRPAFRSAPGTLSWRRVRSGGGLKLAAASSLDQEHEGRAAALRGNEGVTGFPAEMRDVDRGERVARLDQEALARREAEEGLPRLQHRQRAGEAAEVELPVAVPCDRDHRGLPCVQPVLGSHMAMVSG